MQSLLLLTLMMSCNSETYDECLTDDEFNQALRAIYDCHQNNDHQSVVESIIGEWTWSMTQYYGPTGIECDEAIETKITFTDQFLVQFSGPINYTTTWEVAPLDETTLMIRTQRVGSHSAKTFVACENYMSKFQVGIADAPTSIYYKY